MVLPIVKLGSLVVRTVSKPVASRIKQAAAHHPSFRGLIIDLAQGYHRLTTMMQRIVVGRSTTIEIRPLNEEKAIEAATDLLGELFVFTVAGIAIVYEVQRNARAETKKEENRRQELEIQYFYVFLLEITKLHLVSRKLILTYDALKKRNEALTVEIELMKEKLAQVEQLAKERNMFSFWKWRDFQIPNTEKNC